MPDHSEAQPTAYELAAVIKKTVTGKPLTDAEKAAFRGRAKTGSAFAHNYDEMAVLFGLTRKTLQNAKTRHRATAPMPMADGRHDVGEWANFLINNNVARLAEDAAAACMTDEEKQAAADRPQGVAGWREKELELKCGKLEIENAKAAGELVEAADVQAGLSLLLMAFRQGLNNLPDALALRALNVSDYHEMREIAQNEVNNLMKILGACDFLEQFGVEAPAAGGKPQ